MGPHKTKLLDEVARIVRIKHTTSKLKSPPFTGFGDSSSFTKSVIPIRWAKKNTGFSNSSRWTMPCRCLKLESSLAGMLFIHRNVLKKDLPFIAGIERAKKGEELPVVFSPQEPKTIMKSLEGNKPLNG
jgi:hypothetical protein